MHSGVRAPSAWLAGARKLRILKIGGSGLVRNGLDSQTLRILKSLHLLELHVIRGPPEYMQELMHFAHTTCWAGMGTV